MYHLINHQKNQLNPRLLKESIACSSNLCLQGRTRNVNMPGLLNLFRSLKRTLHQHVSIIYLVDVCSCRSFLLKSSDMSDTVILHQKGKELRKKKKKIQKNEIKK